MFAAIAAASAAFAAPMLIPAPREMSVTGGRVALVAADAYRQNSQRAKPMIGGIVRMERSVVPETRLVAVETSLS